MNFSAFALLGYAGTTGVRNEEVPKLPNVRKLFATKDGFFRVETSPLNAAQ